MNILNFKFQIQNATSYWKLDIRHWILEIPAKRQEGFIALTTILLVLAVTMGIAVTVTYSSIGEAQSGLALFKGEENLQFIEGCAEDALLKARSNSAFGDPTGTPVTITRPEGTCSITVVSKSGVTWTMNVTSSGTTYKRTIQIIFNRNATGITLTSWKEI